MKATDGSPIEAMYSREMKVICDQFEADGDGLRAIGERSALLDAILRRLWGEACDGRSGRDQYIAIVAVGGYGRSELFPCSDVDLLFCSEKPLDADMKEIVRRITQTLWDCGLRASPSTRSLSECERFAPENAEFSFSLLDRRLIAGSSAIFEKLDRRLRSKLLARDAKSMRAELASITRERHAKYGNTIFHLEPNIKECPGGLRDVNVCDWLDTLSAETETFSDPEFMAASTFLVSLRCFLHMRHQRDDNVLDWQAQDAAAAKNIGMHVTLQDSSASAWMRSYFRHARVIDRRLSRALEMRGLAPNNGSVRRQKLLNAHGYRLQDGYITIDAPASLDPAADPDVVLGAFAAVASTGAKLSVESEERVASALPVLAAHLDDWPALWSRLSLILEAPRAGSALRAMHAIGLLDLILPEFHGIDALVIRDAYHRYTVDEHTFVLIDVLHELESASDKHVPEWQAKFGSVVRELHHRAALFLAALLHDTGKGRVSDDHAIESARIARGVVARLELDSYEAELVLNLIETHLYMSAALRRDIFDTETVKAFSAKVQTHELLRMLTVFTYADIQAVHPDALTPWKAENLWRLFMNTANQLDRNVDEERIHTRGQHERVAQLLELLRPQRAELELFLEGFPERYLRTRSKETIIEQFLASTHLKDEPFQISLQYAAAMSEVTVITQDKSRLFSGIAGALAAWGMNVISAEGFANASGIVVDTFRFTDTYRTLELNESERSRFLTSLRDLISGRASIESMLKGRRGRRRRELGVTIETVITFDSEASRYSTLLQVVAQDTPGLLRTVSETLSNSECNVEVALIDTEGETAIDVFYLTYEGKQLEQEKQVQLSEALRAAIETNAA